MDQLDPPEIVKTVGWHRVFISIFLFLFHFLLMKSVSPLTYIDDEAPPPPPPKDVAPPRNLKKI